MEKYYILGYPLGHSISPLIHTSLFKLSNRSAEYFVCENASLDKAMEILSSADGFNVTIPYKTDIIAHLTGVDSTAKNFASVNVVDKNKVGHNTDIFGFLKAVQTLSPLGGKILLLGLGGVGKTFAKACLEKGADLRVAVRNNESPSAINNYNELKKQFPHVQLVCLDDIPKVHFDLIINSTPVGMFPDRHCPISDDVIARCTCVYDCIYNPVQTPLLKKASALGKKTLGGLSMLVWQAVEAHRIWYGAEFNKNDIKALIRECENFLHAHFPQSEEV